MGERSGQFRLLVVDGTTSALVDLPPQGILLVGRAPEADIPLTDRSASRRHARLFVEQGGVRVADLESHNGVRVNGQAVSQVHPLQPGDVVSLGEVQLVLYAGAGGAARSPASGGGSLAQAEELVLGERVIVVADPALHRLYGLIRRLAASELPVLILGETGAGKENAAFSLHHWSRRTAKPFVAINCATIAESLAESELFGHEKGAFTGASAPKLGLLETAQGGTVFLDEVGELPLASQAKLLRALETRRILRVGGTQEREIDIRIVAATHRHLEKEVEAGRFRKDLFFRLGAASVVLPPLRDRPAEVGVLARRFLAEAWGAQARPPPALSAACLEALSRYDWPGNVRELKNAMGYVAATVAEETVEPAHLPERILAALQAPARPGVAPAVPPSPVSGPAEGSAPSAPGPRFAPLAEELRTLERERMAEALRATGGVKVRAAELLGMPLRTFTLKCKQYGL
ncbi:DNA-binding transcriptional response regulator, NtrC family, contains REC, AAA-type ATPase, and a Fis-type DNA-binding domains [Stigmatella aurantiaca]|uniref:DNA-binding transcriptional response regulator, NtrC family, contains REC, AAA-type ATPase, and a Fis-type DNA-binding domains n=2 Tax=Stigmatella aurantiaca TaxID=41 RepID=A0A1H7WTS9_STIAU|nr:DNA-binding transcriptional response regulator, NtrC family, contains REC, AAA-type ATPase, and a Fis-type DNA-binding domains [Stigmatella aurantiaca]